MSRNSEHESTADTSKNKYSDLQASMRSKISPIEPGLTLVVLRNSNVMEDARAALEYQAVTHGSKLGLPMPEVKTLISVLSGSRRFVEAARAKDLVQNTDAYIAKKQHISCGTRNGFDWCSDEGLCVLEPIINGAKNKWVTLEQAIKTPLDVFLLNGLARIHEVALAAGAYVMLFLSCAEGYETTRLDQLYEYIEVDECEPDPGMQTAFSLQCLGLSNMHDQGIGHVMLGVNYLDGKCIRKSNRFVSKYLRDRVMWKLRGAGKSYSEIGRYLKLDKSNVKRHLDKLPTPIQRHINADYLRNCAELLSLDMASSPQNAGDEEFDEGQHDESDDQDDI
jgi:hypothetical protein